MTQECDQRVAYYNELRVELRSVLKKLEEIDLWLYRQIAFGEPPDVPQAIKANELCFTKMQEQLAWASSLNIGPIGTQIREDAVLDASRKARESARLYDPLQRLENSSGNSPTEEKSPDSSTDKAGKEGTNLPPL